MKKLSVEKVLSLAIDHWAEKMRERCRSEGHRVNQYALETEAVTCKWCGETIRSASLRRHE